MCQKRKPVLAIFGGRRVLAICILLGTFAVPSLSGDDRWFIDPSGRTGRITAQTTSSDLVRIFGAKNIGDGEVELGEGISDPATVVFPNDSWKRIAIAWKDSTNKRNPDRVQITGGKSQWKTSLGLTLGIPLRQLEQINGRPFLLTNYETDYEGSVRSWEGGVFDSEMESQGLVAVRLLRPAKLFVTVEEFDKVTGGGLEISSSNPILRKMNPRVSEITWSFK